MGEKTQIDMERLRTEIREMQPHHTIFKVLRDELVKIGRWRNLKRGKPNFKFRRQL